MKRILAVSSLAVMACLWLCSFSARALPEGALGIFYGHSYHVTSVAFSPDGGLLASGSADKTAKLWDISTFQEVKTFIHDNYVSSVAFSPDGSLLASGDEDSFVKLWDLSTFQEVKMLSHSWDGWVTSVAFSPDGSLLASGDEDNVVKLWDVSTFQEVRILTGHDDYVNSVAFSPDGSLLASGSDDHTVKLWDLSTFQVVSTLTGHDDYVNSVAFSPDGSLLASGSDDDTVKLWDLSTFQVVSTLTGHDDYVNSVAFSPDGSLLASGDDDSLVKLWDVATFQEVKTFTGHDDYVTSVAFSPDGSLLASGSEDATILLWTVPSSGNPNDGTPNGGDDPTSGLVAYWNFDESQGTTVHDMVGNNDGTINGIPMWVTGYLGGGLEFDGTTNYVDCGADTSLDITDAITIAAWIKGDIFQAWDGLVVKGVNSSSFAMQVWDDGALRFSSNWGILNDAVGTGAFNSDTKITQGEWTHAAITYDGSQIKFYINGIQDTLVVDQSITFGTNMDPLILGCDMPGGNEYFDGVIDEVRIYDYALTGSEVNQIMGGTTLPPPDGGGAGLSGTDIAISPYFNWISQNAADREAGEIVQNVSGSVNDIRHFALDESAEIADWVVAHTDNGKLDVLILFGSFPASIYPPGNAEPDGSIAERFLEAGNMIINTADYIFYVASEGSWNVGPGLENMMDLPGISMWTGGNMETTATGGSYLPGLSDYSTARALDLTGLESPWEAEAIFAASTDGRFAEPVVMHDVSTDGRLVIFYQVANDDAPRGEVISQFILNWLPEVVGGSPGDTAPFITAGPFANNITSTSAVITWSTDEASSSVVEYGQTSGLGLIASGPGNVTNHYVSVSSLSPDTLYYYDVVSADPSGNTVRSAQMTFRTDSSDGPTSNLSGLVLHLPFEEEDGISTEDTSGYGNHGELVGNVQWVTGKYGNAVYISDDSADNKVVVRDHDTLDITDEITMAAWVYVETMVNTWGSILTKADSYMLHTDIENISDVRVEPVIHVGGSLGTWPSEAGVQIPLGQWHHVVGIYDGQEKRTYIDGELRGSFPREGDIPITNSDIAIGRDNRLCCFGRRAALKIDDVMIFNRAISDDEVRQIMAGITPDQPGDVTAPLITTGPAANNITSASAEITWSTDEASSSVVEYGQTSGYGLTANGTGNTMSHSVTLSSLLPNTTYYYRVVSSDSSGNTVRSGGKSFTTNSESTPGEFILVGTDPNDAPYENIDQVFASSEDGKITFEVTTHGSYGKDVGFYIGIDADQNMNTGPSANGAEYSAHVFLENGSLGGGLGLYDPTADQYVLNTSANMTAYCVPNSDVFRVTIELNDIGNPDIINFHVWMMVVDLGDRAPDDGLYTYELPGQSTPGEHSYMVITQAMTWTDAKAYAESLGGHLVTISSAEENTLVTDLAIGEGASRFWIGLTDEAEEGNFVWVTGEPLVYENWFFTEPNDLNNEDYGEIGHYGGYTWNDVRGVNTNPFVVEFEGTDQFPDVVSDSIVKVVVEPVQPAGTDFWVEIQVGDEGSPVDNLIGVSFKLEYTNTTIIDALETVRGDFLGGDSLFFPDINDASGIVSMGISRKAEAGGVNGYGTVAKIKMRFTSGISAGEQSVLTLTDVAANDPDGNTIQFTPQGATVESGGLTVWPGDNNNNGLVDEQDVLPIGVYWGKTGPARSSASGSWVGQTATAWDPKEATYADANGDGVVDERDVLPIGINWHKTHGSTPSASPMLVANMDHTPYLLAYEELLEAVGSLPAEESTTRMQGILETVIRIGKRQIIPEKTAVLQNYPNPFNPETWIPFQLAEDAEVRITIYSASGLLIRTLDLGPLSPGTYIDKGVSAYWDGRNDHGEQASSDIYFCHVQAGDFTAIRKMILCK